METCSLNITEHVSAYLLHVRERCRHMLYIIDQQIYIIDYTLGTQLTLFYFFSHKDGESKSVFAKRVQYKITYFNIYYKMDH